MVCRSMALQIRQFVKCFAPLFTMKFVRAKANEKKKPEMINNYWVASSFSHFWRFISKHHWNGIQIKILLNNTMFIHLLHMMKKNLQQNLNFIGKIIFLPILLRFFLNEFNFDFLPCWWRHRIKIPLMQNKRSAKITRIYNSIGGKENFLSIRVRRYLWIEQKCWFHNQ